MISWTIKFIYNQTNNKCLNKKVFHPINIISLKDGIQKNIQKTILFIKKCFLINICKDAAMTANIIIKAGIFSFNY